MPAKAMETAPETAPATDTVFERDLYMLAPFKLPRGQQYAVSSSDGQMLLLVKRDRRAAVAPWRSVASIATGLIVLGFISSFGDSLGGPVIKWSAVAVGCRAGVPWQRWRSIPRCWGSRLATFSRRERPAEKVLEVKQADRSRAFEASCTITGAKGRLLGTVRRNYLASLLRTQWVLYGAGGEPIAKAREDSMPRAIGARLLGWAVPTLRSNFALDVAGGIAARPARAAGTGAGKGDVRPSPGRARRGSIPSSGSPSAVLIDLDER